MNHEFLIQPSVGGRSGCSHVLAVVKCAVLNLGAHGSLRIIVLVFFDKCPEVQLLSRNGVPVLVVCLANSGSLCSLFSPPSPKLGKRSMLCLPLSLCVDAAQRLSRFRTIITVLCCFSLTDKVVSCGFFFIYFFTILNLMDRFRFWKPHLKK